MAEKTIYAPLAMQARDKYRLFAPAAPKFLVAEVLKLLDAAAEISSSREYTCSKIDEL